MARRVQKQTLVALTSAIFVGLAACNSLLLQPLLAEKLPQLTQWTRELIGLGVIVVFGGAAVAATRRLWSDPAVESTESWTFLARTIVFPARLRVRVLITTLREDFHMTPESLADHRDCVETFLQDTQQHVTRGCLEDLLFRGRGRVLDIAKGMRGMAFTLQGVYDTINERANEVSNDDEADAVRDDVAPALEAIVDRVDGYWHECLENIPPEDAEFLGYLFRKSLA